MQKWIDRIRILLTMTHFGTESATQRRPCQHFFKFWVKLIRFQKYNLLSEASNKIIEFLTEIKVFFCPKIIPCKHLVDQSVRCFSLQWYWTSVLFSFFHIRNITKTHGQQLNGLNLVCPVERTTEKCDQQYKPNWAHLIVVLINNLFGSKD